MRVALFTPIRSFRQVADPSKTLGQQHREPVLTTVAIYKCDDTKRDWLIYSPCPTASKWRVEYASEKVS